jgi:small-conductance mechanosensitive channel
MVNGPSSNENASRERRARLIFIAKVLIYGALIYTNINYPEYFADRMRVVERIMHGLYVFLGGNIVISLAQIIIRSWYIRRHNITNLQRDNFLLGVKRVSSVLNGGFALVAVSVIVGVDLTKITIVAAAIALLSKEYITNIINGLIIMFSDQLSLGDQIKVGEFQGKILDITLVNVVLQNDDDDIVIVPNTMIFNTLIVNQSKQNIKKMTIEFEMDLKFFATPTELESQLKDSLQPFTSNITANSFSLKTLEIKKDLCRFKVQFLIPRHDKEMERRMKRAITTEILSITKREVEH